MKYLLVVLFVLVGCTRTDVSPANNQVFDGGRCDLRVFQTKGMALDKGPIKEVCVVKGNNAFTWDFSEAGAIKKIKKKVCGCGVENAYIQSSMQESDMGFRGVFYVTLVGFKYTGEKKQGVAQEPPSRSGLIGKYQYNAGELAKEHGCEAPEVLTQNPPVEMYQTTCSGNHYVIKCEWNNCKVVQ